MRHGFEKICVPRYWISLTRKGGMAINTGFHHSFRTRIPEPILGFFLDLRKSFTIGGTILGVLVPNQNWIKRWSHEAI
jgi:hypothetical protein